MTTKARRWARRSLTVVALGAIVAAVLLLVMAAKNYTALVTSYRVVDDRTIAVQVVGGPRTWCRLTNTAETASAVRVSAECLDWLPGPGAAFGRPVELTVRLTQPLSDRVVFDGAGSAVVNFALLKCHDNVCAPSPSP